jgi:hypothetical protein
MVLGVLQQCDFDVKTAEDRPSILNAEMENIPHTHKHKRMHTEINGLLISYSGLSRKECKLARRMWDCDLCIYLYICIYI